MPLREALRSALGSLRAHKLRSFLTTLGIVIGVSSVIAVVAIIDGLDRYIADEVLSLGTGSFSYQKFPQIFTSLDDFVEAARRPSLRLADVDAVREACRSCAEVGGSLSVGRTVEWRSLEHERVQILGMTENIARIGGAPDLAAGRPILQPDVDRRARVAVIGDDVREALFQHVDPVGQTLVIDRHHLTVVGVAESAGTFFGISRDNFVWIPITTFQAFYGARRSVTIQAEARSLDDLSEAIEEGRLALRVRHHLAYGDPDDFDIETGETLLTVWQNATRGIYAATLLVTAISLVVGGVVVMNIMLVSVTERTAEIGLRRALGARRRDVLRQFLVEAVLLATVGGVVGVLGAAVFSQLLSLAVSKVLSVAFRAPLHGWAVLLALVVSTGVGVLAGYYPSRRAAELDPVAALRSE